MDSQRKASFADSTAELVTVELALSSSPACGDTCVIAIDGRSASGKTTLATAVAARLDGAPIIHLEDLYGGWDGLSNGVLRAQVDALMPLSQRQTTKVPAYNWTTKAWGPETTLDAPPFLIVEGCGAGSVGLANWTSVLVWVETDAESRKARAQQRPDWTDFAPRWDAWAAQEDEHIAQNKPADRADLVVTG